MSPDGMAPRGLVDLAPCRLQDSRGGLDKFFAPPVEQAIGRSVHWRQVLRSRTARQGVLRGLHAQLPPSSEAKLLVPLKGRMFWVALDLRAGSPAFGRWQARTLSPDDGGALFVERGFAHGCLSLSGDVELLILADNDYRPERGVGIAWDDPELAIDWPLDGARPRLSPAHAAFPGFAEFRQRHGGL